MPGSTFGGGQSQQVAPAHVAKQMLEAQKELLSASFSQAQAYTNLILGAGYAGLFAVWAFTRESLAPWLVLSVGLLATLSLMTFVLFEVYKSFYWSTALMGLSEALRDESRFLERLQKVKQDRVAADIRFGRIWTRAFWFTLGTGLLAALVLVFAFVYGLIVSYLHAPSN